MRKRRKKERAGAGAARFIDEEAEDEDEDEEDDEDVGDAYVADGFVVEDGAASQPLLSQQLPPGVRPRVSAMSQSQGSEVLARLMARRAGVRGALADTPPTNGKERRVSAATTTPGSLADFVVDDDAEEGSDDDEEEDPNDDICAACGTGGELVCCDDCPRSWHLGCAGLARAPRRRAHWSCPMCTGGGAGPSTLRAVSPVRPLPLQTSMHDDNGSGGGGDDDDDDVLSWGGEDDREGALGPDEGPREGQGGFVWGS